MADDAQSSPLRERRSLRSRVGIRTFLLAMVLLPTLATVALASSVAVGKWSARDRAVDTRSTTLRLDALMQARADVTDEYVPSAAIADANALHISRRKLDTLLKINFEADLATARAAVDRQSLLFTNPTLAADRGDLLTLRRQLDAGSASLSEVQLTFSRLTGDIDALWLAAFNGLAISTGLGGAATSSLQREANALQLAYSSFTEGLEQSEYAQQILTSAYSPTVVTDLIGVDELLEKSTVGFPGNLGPRAAAAWKKLQNDAAIRRYDSAVTLAVQTGLRGGPPPYAENISANAVVFRGLIRKVSSLTALVLSASADLRATAAADETAVTHSFLEELALLTLLAILVVGAALWVAGAISRPLAGIAEAAGAVREGDFDVTPLEEAGPRELASAAAAFNEMASTLRAVEAHAVALSGKDLDDTILRTPLPGPTGRALQGTLDRLQASIRETDRRGQELHALATRDSLTGLLNRGAALDAIERDLARADREDTVVALLFLDIDGLKAINDTFGHEGGDEALRVAADVINASTRRSDVRARIGGDEFVVAQLHPASSAEVAAMAERIRRRIAEAEPELHGRRMQLACSIGIAESHASGDTADDVMRRADVALYEAKQAGRDRVVWFRPPESRTA